MRSTPIRLGLLSLLSAASLPVLAAPVEKLSVVANGETVGSLVATTEGRTIVVDFHVDNNGRGPKHREEIMLGADGIPTRIAVQGRSLMGGPVEEHYRWSAGKAEWTSQADHGTAPAARPPVYIVNDDNPYMASIYARAALKSPSLGIDVLPAGRVTVEHVRDVRVGPKDRVVDLAVYRLAGVQLSPGYVLLDRQGKLFATVGTMEHGTAVREGYEGSVPDLARLGRELETERVRQLQQRLAHRFDVPLRITNVQVFDPRSGTRSPPSTVVVMRDMITQVLPGTDGAPADEAVIDGEGGTLYPGLHDMHSHATLESGLLYLAAGVTTTRDMGNSNAFLQDLLPRIRSGEVAWPDIVPAGFLEGRSPYSARYGFIPETLEEAKRNVRWYADRGYAEVKIYNSFNPDWVGPVAAEAHRLGLRVSGHVPAFSSPDRVTRDGYDAIAHINQLMLGWILDSGEDTRTPLRLTAMARGGALDLASPRVQETVRLMKARGTALDTTAVILELLMLSRAGEMPEFARDYADHLPIGYQRYRKRTYVPLGGAEDDAAYRSGFAKVLEVIAMLHKAGVTLLPGTDDATGFTLQREVELYVKAGLSPAEALRIATLGSAEYLGRADRFGTIERGKQADFVLVAGDPTRDITAIKRPRMVLKGGAVYFPSEIYQALAIRPFATAPSVRLPRETAASERPGDAVGFGYDTHSDHE